MTEPGRPTSPRFGSIKGKLMDETILEQAIALLSAASPDKPWMTASYLGRKMGGGIEGKRIEQILLAYCREAEDSGDMPKIRYSSLPSRKTLEVLWGAIEHVGTRPLENITQDHVAHDAFDECGDLDRADIFISHSHRDFDAVSAVARHLLEADLVPWLAETHIQKDRHIHEEIIGALGDSQDFLLYLSPNALDSRWTGKEYIYAQQRGIPIYVVGDADVPEIRALLELMLRRETIPNELAERFEAVDRDFLYFLTEDNEGIIETFAYTSEPEETSLPDGVRPVTELASRIRARRGDRAD